MRFKQWLEWSEDNEIRGEYWIVDGRVDFADGDIGDNNHESIAINHILWQYADGIESLAQDLGLEVELQHYGEPDSEAIQQAIDQIYEALQLQGMVSPDAYVMQQLGCDAGALQILSGGGDARQYVIDHLGWIAIRKNNVELSGYDVNRQKAIAEAIREILYEEKGLDDVDAAQVDLTIMDHQNGKSWYVTLEDLERPQVAARSQQIPMPVGRTQDRGWHRDHEEGNPFSATKGGAVKPWNIAARNAGIGMELWRGTSETALAT